MGSGVVLASLYLATAAAAAGSASWLGRRIPALVLAAGIALPVLFLLPGFATERTLLPVDHALAYPPWKTPATLFPRNPNLNDAATQFAPWAKAVRMAWKEGELPWRNRWNGCGSALAANGSASPFSPLTILMLALPLARAFTLAAAVKLLLAWLGVWLWLTELGVSSRGALLGAAAFGFSFTMTPWLLFPQTAVIALWPWALFAIERLRRPDVAVRAFVLLAAVFTLWPLAGHLESVASGAGFTGVLLLSRWIAGDLPDATRLFSRISLAAAVGLGLSAFALLPQLAAIAASNRLVLASQPFWAGHLSWIPHGPAWPAGLLLPLLPRHYGDAMHTPMRADAPGAFPEMALGSIGLVAWTAALLTLRPGSRRPRTVLALTAPLAAGLAIAVGQWPFAELAACLPGLRWMYPLRFFSWVALAGSALASFEADRLARDWPRASAATALALSGLCLLELVPQGRDYYVYGSPADLFPDRPVLAYLRRQEGPYRVVGEDDVLFPGTNVFAGLEDIRTHDPVERRDYVEFLDRECGYKPADYFKKVGDLNCRGLDRLGVKFLLARPGRPSPGPKWEPVYDGADATAFRNTAARPLVEATGVTLGGYRETTNTVAFHASVPPEAGEATISTSLAEDGGWSARDAAGRRIPTGRAPDGPFLTLRLAPGEHDVRLIYRPPLYAIGTAASGSTALAVAFAAWRLRRRRYGQVENAAVS